MATKSAIKTLLVIATLFAISSSARTLSGHVLVERLVRHLDAARKTPN